MYLMKMYNKVECDADDNDDIMVVVLSESYSSSSSLRSGLPISIN